ncbi:MAG: L,D-transpeptidase [Gammaproteobacteria bacterium]|nr:L,D-transpeptidase [Gammaproteobacteria bacterium]
MRIEISLAKQQLQLLEGAGELLFEAPVSTASLGAGEQSGSGQTPRGLHRVRARIGDGLPLNSVLVGRRPTGEIYSPELAAQFPGRDWILTRILWLCGSEPGFNRLGQVDSMRRYIYIHGTPESEPMGVIGSHGCIRMGNDAVCELFDRVPVGTDVMIREG